MANRNPILKCFDIVHDQWVVFAESDARILRWVLEPDEVGVIEAFLDKEADDAAGELSDIFIRLDQPFDTSNTYGRTLAKVIGEQMEASRAELNEVDMPIWSPPFLPASMSDVDAFVAICASLYVRYQDHVDVLGLVLVPSSVDDAEAWLQWIRVLMPRLPPNVRIVLLDHAQAPVYESLSRSCPNEVMTVVANLDMPNALDALVESIGEDATPGAQVRKLFIEIGRAAGDGDMARVQEKGERAVKIARQHEMLLLAATIHMQVGTILLGAGKPLQAIPYFRSAEDDARAAEPQDGKVAITVLIKARFGLGVAVIDAEGFPQAAELYRMTAPISKAIGDKFSELECWRMASYCFERANDTKFAWECGVCAWEVTKQLSEEERKNSTAPFVAEALMRLSSRWGFEHYAVPIEREIVEALGQDWRVDVSSSGGHLS